VHFRNFVIQIWFVLFLSFDLGQNTEVETIHIPYGTMDSFVALVRRPPFPRVDFIVRIAKAHLALTLTT
jgi:hypothetical protein